MTHFTTDYRKTKDPSPAETLDHALCRWENDGGAIRSVPQRVERKIDVRDLERLLQ